MNGINGLIALNKNREARNAISKFSSLLRSLLNQGDQSKIPIEDELSFLEDYLKLEQTMRNTSFEFNIENTSSVSQVPPMLIQPFLENSIIHGFQNLNRPAQLSILIKDKGKYIQVEIQDNGVGRNKVQGKPLDGHVSKAIKITEERLRTMDKWKESKWVEYKDLKNAQGEAIGTLVILNIPK